MTGSGIRTRVVVAVVLVVIVAIVAGCAGGITREQAHRGSVDEKTRQEVIKALTAAGVTPEATTELRISWKQSEPDTVIAEGSFANPKQPTSSAAGPGVYEVHREADGSWTVRGVR